MTQIYTITDCCLSLFALRFRSLNGDRSRLCEFVAFGFDINASIVFLEYDGADGGPYETQDPATNKQCITNKQCTTCEYVVDGFAGIHVACSDADYPVETCECLHLLGGDLEHAKCTRNDSRLLTPLHMACQLGSYEKVAFLCRAGVQIDPLDCQRMSPLCAVIRTGLSSGYSDSCMETRMEIARFLIESGGADYLGSW